MLMQINKISKKYKLYILVNFVMGILFVLYIFHKVNGYVMRPKIHQFYKIKSHEYPIVNKGTTKYILILTKTNKYANNIIETLNDSQNCMITENPDLLKKQTLYDAIVFPLVRQSMIFDITLASIRSPHQYYVFATNVSPANIQYPCNNFYNWTMSYHLNSDIPWFQYIIQDKITNEIIAPRIDPIWRDFDNNFNDSELMEIITKKMANENKIIWISTMCKKSLSGLEDLVLEIRKHIKTDIFGLCNYTSYNQVMPLNLENILKYNYSFYLSFETILCPDYVTEKLYNYMDHLIIPIVYGGANYTYFAPPYSYINANDFKTTRDLVEYLLYLINNPEEYIKYFWWKKYYKIVQPPKYRDLCKKLFTINKNNSNNNNHYDIMINIHRDNEKSNINCKYLNCTINPYILFNRSGDKNFDHN